MALDQAAIKAAVLEYRNASEALAALVREKSRLEGELEELNAGIPTAEAREQTAEDALLAAALA